MTIDGASVSASVASHGGRLALRDFLVDFLGCLVPGVVFLIAAILAGLPPLLRVIDLAEPDSPSILASLKLPDGAVAYVLGFGLFLLFAYIWGQLFFRQDPKVPDEASYKRIKGTLEEQGPVRAESGKTTDVQFPYLFLHEYLVQRGLRHLAVRVPWQGCNAATHPARTKHFINILKVRLAFSFPDRCGALARNEAHIRLNSSMWYVSRSLVVLGVAALVVSLVCGAIDAAHKESLLPVAHLSSVLYPAAVLALALWLKVGIERVLHYQRVRECVFVLETAHWANEHSDKDIFGGLACLAPQVRQADTVR